MIQTTVKGTNLELTSAIDAAIDKAAKMIDKYVDQKDSGVFAQIEVSRTTYHHRSGDIFRAEINLRSRIGDFRAEAEREDLYAAIIAAKDEMVEALRSRKSKRKDFARRSRLAIKNMLRGLPWRKR